MGTLTLCKVGERGGAELPFFRKRYRIDTNSKIECLEVLDQNLYQTKQALQ